MRSDFQDFFGDSGATIEFDLDLNRIVEGIDGWFLNELEQAISIGITSGLDELRDRMYEKCMGYLELYGLGGSSLADGIEITRMGDSFSIVSYAPYTQYVEFGTGIIGEENPHPHAWEYDVNCHGEAGWIYKGDDGKLHWTLGQSSKPFMYRTWLWAKRSATSIIRKNIRREIKRIRGSK